MRAAQPPVRSCCPPGSQSTFCDAHRVATLPAQYRFLPALRHVEAFLTLEIHRNRHPHFYPQPFWNSSPSPSPSPSPRPNLSPSPSPHLDPDPIPKPIAPQTRQGLRRLRGAPLPLAGLRRRRLLRLPHALALARPRLTPRLTPASPGAGAKPGVAALPAAVKSALTRKYNQVPPPV